MEKKVTVDRKTWNSLVALVLLAVYLFVVRRWVSPASASLLEGVILLGLLLALGGSVLGLLVSGLAYLFSKNRRRWRGRLRRMGITSMVVTVLLALIVLASQWTAYTPPIMGEDGKPAPGSIAGLRKVRLGGTDQWLIVRGQDVNNPVLLFLSGGPGGSEAGRVLNFNQELEKHFTVVIWEQRGCGKSYASLNPKSALTVEQYTADLIELADMLTQEFSEEKIYLLGHSWGTIIGVHAVQARPDLFHAYIGTAQMADVLQTDRVIYEMMVDYARSSGDVQLLQSLEKQGPPPYTGPNAVMAYAGLFSKEFSVFEAPHIKSEKFLREGDLSLMLVAQPEFGWLDRINNLRALVDTFNVVYPQLQEFDFRKNATHFEVPVYMILGRHDMNDPYWLPEEYFNLIQAPDKQLYFFEDSGHGMLWQETDKFHDLMINIILPETYQP